MEEPEILLLSYHCVLLTPSTLNVQKLGRFKYLTSLRHLKDK